jgi:HEAT repeat protein
MFPRSRTITFEAALRDLANSTDPRTRAASAASLGDIDPGDRREAVRGLTRAVRDDHPDVRAAAAYSLGHLLADLGDASAVRALCDGLDDLVALPRQSCAIALGRIGDASAFDRLATALTYGPADLRFQAATSLCEIDPERAFEVLCGALRSEADGEVVCAIALALGEIGDPRAADALAGALDHSVDQTRFDVAYALASLGDARAVAVLAAFAAHKALTWPAIEGLENTADASAVDALAPLLMRRRTPRLYKVRAAAAILALDPDGAAARNARATLTAALRSWRFEVRALAVESLRRVGGDWSRAPLQALRASAWGRRLQDEITDALGS